jgi:cytochrome P450
MSKRNPALGGTEVVPAAPPHYPFGPVQALDLHTRYAELRQHEPIARVTMPFGGEAWLLTGDAEIKQFLVDPRFSSLAATEPDTARVTPLPLRPGNLLSMDPPEHTRIRRVVAKAFTMRRVEWLRGRIQEVAEERLDELATQGPPCDLVAGLAVPLPVVMICELFGIPYADRARFRRYSDVLVATTAHGAEEIDRSRKALEEYELYARLVAQPDVVPTAIEELLRYIPLRSVGSFPRRATEDVVLAGVLIRKGDTVIFQRASADRDERTFTCPEDIDLMRRPNPHLGFGHGAHHCLGAQLARVELTVAIEGLLRSSRPCGSPSPRRTCRGSRGLSPGVPSAFR